MKWLSVFFSLLLLAGCASFTSTPKISLYQYKLKLVEPVESDALKYGDENINISFTILRDDVSLRIANKLDKPIKLLYGQAVYVDQYNLAHATIHSTLSLLTSETHSSPIVIPPKTELFNFFAPVDKIAYITKWKKFVLIEPFVRAASVHPQWENLKLKQYDSTVSKKEIDKEIKKFLLDLDKEAKANVGKRIGIFLPIEIDDEVKDYFFKFEITDVETVPTK